MKKFLLESKKTGAIIIVGYRKGILVYLDMKEGVSNLQAMWAHEKVPLPYAEFEAFEKYAKKQGIIVSEFLDDLRFTYFWNTYDYKKGKKISVERLWKSMPDTEKNKALAYLKKYNFFLAENSHIPKLYPQTYLNRKEWDN